VGVGFADRAAAVVAVGLLGIYGFYISAQIEYQNKPYDIDQKDEGTLDDRRRDGGTNSTLRIKEQGTHLTLNEHDDDVFI